MPAFHHDGHAIHYSDEGPRDGLPVVFSNSLGTDFRAWDPLLPHLPSGCRIIRYDKAGHGLSDFAGERPIEAHAEDVAALLDHVKVEKAVIVGLSVGGLIAQAFTSANPDRVLAMVLCDTGHKIGTPEIWNPRFEMPTLCFVGADDGATPPALMRELASLIEGAVFKEVPDCGHLPCIEQPEALAAAITGLLSDNGLV